MVNNELEFYQKLNDDEFSSKKAFEKKFPGLRKTSEAKTPKYIVDRVSTNDSQIVMNNFHVASCSDKHTPKDDFIGIVVYSFDGKLEWTLNGCKYKSGYIVYKKIKNLRRNGTLHSQCFASAFGKTDVEYQNDGHSIIVSEFSYRGSKSRGPKGFIFDLNIFNEKDCSYYCEHKNNSRVMSALEHTGVKQAIENWDGVTSAVTRSSAKNENVTHQHCTPGFYFLHDPIFGIVGYCGM